MAATAGLGLAGASSLLGMGSAYGQAEAGKLQAAHSARMGEINAGLAEMQGQQALRIGDKQAEANNRKVKQTIGAQRVALAAQGIEVDSGTAAEIQEQTAEIGAEDAMNIRNNAWREAWGYKVQANDYRAQAAIGIANAKMAAKNTLLTGGMNALNTMGSAWGNYGKDISLTGSKSSKSTSATVLTGQSYNTKTYT